MEATTVNKVAELYKRKSDLLGTLSDLVSEEYTFEIGRRSKNIYCGIYGITTYRTLSSSFLAEIKKLTEAHINQQIEEIDKELNEL